MTDLNNQAQSLSFAGAPSLVTPRIQDALRRTKPWVRLIGGLGFITSALIWLSGAVMLIKAGTVGILNMAIGCFVCYVAVKLFRYGTRIEEFLASNALEDLEQALEAQRAFWKAMGVVAVAAIVLFALQLILAVILAATMR
ncbi:MAG: hypothetical protein RL112_562 [Planctomycetota bacterium]|jgi:hypothetical protein